MRLTVSLFSALSRALDHIPNAFALAQDIELEKKTRCNLSNTVQNLSGLDMFALSLGAVCVECNVNVVLCCVWVCGGVGVVCCVWCGVFCVCVVRTDRPSAGPPFRGTAKNFALFPSPAPFFFICFSLWGLLVVEFWWCLKLLGPENMHVWER